jgi:hypothetical protein
MVVAPRRIQSILLAYFVLAAIGVLAAWAASRFGLDAIFVAVNSAQRAWRLRAASATKARFDSYTFSQPGASLVILRRWSTRS